ncbi:hypothetical protein HDU97_003998 [Phlyctochytrium planicorne]|nr:hypothetical protein HDU97_003998 [Phlyctochytrium planicorne]
MVFRIVFVMKGKMKCFHAILAIQQADVSKLAHDANKITMFITAFATYGKKPNESLQMIANIQLFASLVLLFSSASSTPLLPRAVDVVPGVIRTGVMVQAKVPPVTPINVAPFTSALPVGLSATAIAGSSVVNGISGAASVGTGMRMTLAKGGGGVSAVAPRGFKAGEAACAKIKFPGTDYSGVAMTFYSIGSNTNSAQSGSEDEIDFEFLGSANRAQFNYFKKGAGGHEFLVTPTGNTMDLCMANTGTSIKWFVNGQLALEKADSLGDMFVWFTIWETAGLWDCCGTAIAPDFTMDVQQFSVFKLA